MSVWSMEPHQLRSYSVVWPQVCAAISVSQYISESAK